MAGAIAFNMVVAFVPLLIAILGIAGTVLGARGIDPGVFLEDFLPRYLPAIGSEYRGQVTDWLNNLIEDSPRLLGLGTAVFVWLATRLVGTLRTALREVFDVQRDRGIVAGKLFDLKMVVVAGVLFSINVALTLGIDVVASFGFNLLGVIGLAEGQISFAQFLWARLLAFAFLWTTFFLIYRYLPARRTSARTSLTAATFAALFTELLKEGFSWYVTGPANYTSAYGNLATIIILVLWIYYTSVVFILAGEIAQVAAMQRARRRQKERLA